MPKLGTAICLQPLSVSVNAKHLGDSYDLVKRSLLACLEELGLWHVHPMFTAAFNPGEIKCYQDLLGVPLITSEPLPIRPKREAHIELAHVHGHVLFDPDTGLKMNGRVSAPRKYLFKNELLAAVRARPSVLTAVFDQSLSHGKAESELIAKAKALAQNAVRCFAYSSHASFIFVSADAKLLESARKLLLQAGIPEKRDGVSGLTKLY